MSDIGYQMEAESRNWPRTKGGQKVMCPECGASGYAGNKWTRKHHEHVACPECGKQVTPKGLSTHRRMHK